MYEPEFSIMISRAHHTPAQRQREAEEIVRFTWAMVPPQTYAHRFGDFRTNAYLVGFEMYAPIIGPGDTHDCLVFYQYSLSR